MIVGTCVNDAVCTEVCPVNCIQPGPQSPDYLTAEMLYIDPNVCIDCDACADACPIDAIYPAQKLPDEWSEYAAINAAYFGAGPGP